MILMKASEHVVRLHEACALGKCRHNASRVFRSTVFQNNEAFVKQVDTAGAWGAILLTGAGAASRSDGHEPLGSCSLSYVPALAFL